VTRRQRRCDGTIALTEALRDPVSLSPSGVGTGALFPPESVSCRPDRSPLAILCLLYPLDKAANASGERRRLETTDRPLTETPPVTGLPSLLGKLLEEYFTTGRPRRLIFPKNDDSEGV